MTDLADVVRVGITYTLGDGVWTTNDLDRVGADGNDWVGTIPDSADIEWLVRALDRAGNLAVHDNKGGYFGPDGYRLWLPAAGK